uniref:ATP dependent Clp protease n=1 Tax=virus sp. ct5rm7 TaxID=2827298 RepID=A0A8S5RGJ1_9VIRU|nr:MAG TPA: Putative ATP dependent Clp protease [virus sp. ct5rm7]
MDINSLQYVVGEVRENEVATIRFFGRVTEETTSRFNDEFDFLENVIRPSCIRVLINSEGGSVLYGMSTYSTIAGAKVDTECIIEGVAASMASIIWAAGRRSLMRDYAILMIHNPMLPGEDADNGASDMVRAFTKQIETIYRKRFGLKAGHIRAIMDGEAGKDGTYFDAAAAVRAGIIPAGNILRTSKQLCERVQNEVAVLTDTTAIQELMSRVSAGDKLFETAGATLNQTENDMANENKTQGFEYGAIAASLGMKDKDVKDVMARISELAALEPKYKELEKSLSDAQTVIAGKEAAIQNLQKDLSTATAQLSTYQKKEREEQTSRIETLVENAITEGKIDREAKAQWVEMATANLALAESTLASIPAREKISAEIAGDPGNVHAAAGAAKTAEQLMAEKVTEVVGENFEFRKLK